MTKRTKKGHLVEPELTIRATLRAFERAGFVVSWLLPRREGDPHVFTALTPQRERFTVSGTDPLKALAELTKQLGFEDLN